MHFTFQHFSTPQHSTLLAGLKCFYILDCNSSLNFEYLHSKSRVVSANILTSFPGSPLTKEKYDLYFIGAKEEHGNEAKI